jgi:hypothetical protein
MGSNSAIIREFGSKIIYQAISAADNSWYQVSWQNSSAQIHQLCSQTG